MATRGGDREAAAPLDVRGPTSSGLLQEKIRELSAAARWIGNDETIERARETAATTNDQTNQEAE